MKRRTVCMLLTALVLLAAITACNSSGEDDEDTANLQGSYERITDNAQARQAETTVIETTFYYNRIPFVPGLTGMPLCEGEESFSSIGDHFFTIHEDNSYSELTVIQHDTGTCYTEETGTLDIQCDRLVTDNGEEADFEFKDDGETLVIHARHEGMLPYEENLLATGNYNWLYGLWERLGLPQETFSMSELGNVQFEFLRQVASRAGSSPQYDAACGFTVSGLDPRLFMHGVSNKLTLEFTARNVSVQPAYEDEIGCAYYVLELDNALMERGLDVRFEVAQVDGSLVIDDSGVYTKTTTQ